jgi:protein SCO1/2
MKKVILVGAVLILLMGTVTGYLFWKEIRSIREASEVLPVLSFVPNFNLVERSGSAISLSDLSGKVWVADFIFTHCAGPCPLLSLQMGALQEPLKELEDVRLVSISVDPERDTPEVLEAYSRRYNADPEKWLFLTGEKADVYQLIRKGFQVTVDNTPEDEASDQIMHSLRFALVDRKGQVRAYYTGSDSDLADRLVPDVKRLLQEK